MPFFFRIKKRSYPAKVALLAKPPEQKINVFNQI